MRSLQNQLQDIADWCHGIKITPKPDPKSFAEGPLRQAWCAVMDESIDDEEDEASRLSRCYTLLQQALAQRPHEGRRLIERIGRVIPYTNRRPFRSLAEIAPELPPVEWLWPGWLCRGMVTLAAAKPGMGKSLIALDLAGRLMTGAAWPDGAPNARPPAPVIYVDGESIPQVHNERAAAWGLPRELLYLLLPQEPDILVDLHTDKYQELLVQMVYRLLPSLVIIDSLGAVLGKGENAVEDVRGVLGYLAAIAQQHKVAVLVIHHLRKGVAGQGGPSEAVDLDSIRGSGHIAAIARVTWGLSPVQTGPKRDPNGPRRLEVIKSNLARKPEPLGVALEPLPGGEFVRVQYTAAPVAYERPPERTPAQEWLLRYLEEAGKPVPVADAVAAGVAKGFSRSTVFYARKALDGEVVNTVSRFDPHNCWQLGASGAGDAELSELSELSKESELSKASKDAKVCQN